MTKRFRTFSVLILAVLAALMAAVVPSLVEAPSAPRGILSKSHPGPVRLGDLLARVKTGAALPAVSGAAQRLVENANIVYVLKPGDHQAGVVGDSINAGKVHSLAFLLQFGALTGDAILSIYSGATAATKTTQETFRYRLADAVQGSATADTFGAWATSSALTLTAATYQNKMLVVEIDSDELTDGQNWCTLDLDSTASALNASVAAVCEPRIRANVIPTVIT